MELLAEAARLLGRSQRAALVTVIGVSGSTPRHVGAHMLVLESGELRGTIGGGRVEKEVIETGVEVARGGRARRIKYHLVRDLAMCCGGTMEFYIEAIEPSAVAIERAASMWERRIPGRIVTPLSGGPKRVEQLEHRRREPAHIEDDELVQMLWPRDRLIVFGAGHVGRALMPLAASVGFQIILCDDDETGALSSSPPSADEVIASFDVRDVQAQLGPVGVGDYVIVVTRDHAIDQELVQALLPLEELSYLGVIGSRGKIGRFRKRLEARGSLNEERWNWMSAPIGIDIGAETPEEIAVSIVAELISVRNRAGQGDSLPKGGRA